MDDSDLTWDKRFPLLLAEVIRSGPADLIGLAECNHFDTHWEPEMKKLGYQGVFSPKDSAPAARFGAPADGVAIFYRTSKCDLITHTTFGTYPVQVIATLKINDKTYTMSMMHLKSKHGFEIKRAKQTSAAMSRIELTDPTDHTIVCGDFNAESDEKCVSIVSQTLKSAYGNGPDWTTWKVRKNPVKHTIDYIFYSAGLTLDTVWEIPKDEDIEEKALPNLQYGSDHIAIGAIFTT